ncbi:helix-turn-helix domain-containing protein [Methyloversatilis discipulorum]|uniref:helix-turn-helix domain-containing protein n=1 Tax=Methyloversatilis discipulorum TaxID=1119528 RepID=UPI0031384684
MHTSETAAQPEELLTAKQAAAFLKVKPGTLACWRTTKRYPLKYTRVGKSIRYRLSDLQAFLAARDSGDDELAQGGE